MLNKAALDQLRVFNEDPCDITASQLIGCPALLSVLLHHGSPYPAPLLSLCRWLYRRGLAVYADLMKQSAADSLLTIPFVERDWREVSNVNQ